jgi:ABC-2 type transport system ATP-binding protein
VRLRDIRGPQRRGAIDRAVVRTGIESVYYRPIGELSKGFRQRVGLAQAIVHEPDLLVLDEPTEGLDPNQRVEIRHLISQVGRDRTVILSTHVLPEVQHTCSRLLIISRGKLVADGPVAQLVARAEGFQQITVEASGAGVAEGLRALAGVTGVAELGAENGRTRAAVTAAGDADLRPAIYRLAVERGWTLYELYQEGGSLEELFRQLTTEGGRA